MPDTVRSVDGKPRSLNRGVQRRTAYTMVLVFIGVAVIANVVYLFFGKPEIGFLRSSLGTSPMGHKAFYELLQQAGFPLERNHALPAQIEGSRGACFLIEPHPHLLKRDADYLRGLADWAARGNTLLIAFPHPEVEQGAAGYSEAFGSAFEALALELIWSCEKEPVDRGTLSAGWEDASARELTLDCETLAVRKVCGFTGTSTSQAQSVVRLNAKPFLLEFQRGQGRIVLVAEASFFENANILKEDNAVFAYNVATRYGQDGILFDEYYHGLYRSPNIVRLMFSFPYNMIAVTFFLCIALFVWARYRYFGPPRPEEEPSRRSKSEYLHAMAALFRSCRKTNMMLRHLVKGLADDLSEAYRLRDVHGPDDVVQRLCACSCTEVDAIAGAFEKVRAALASDRSISEREMFSLYVNLWKPVRKAIHAASKRTL